MYEPQVKIKSSIDLKEFDMKEELKTFDDFVCNPVKILVRLYVGDTGSKIGLKKDDTKELYSSIVGYVAKVGKCCFQGEEFKNWGNWYKEGDWIIIPRHSGIRYFYGGLPVFSIADDAPMGITSDPTKVKR